MSNFKLDRIRFRWKNEWTISTDFIKDDVVYYEGKAYVCLIGHSSDSSNFYNDLNNIDPKWELMFDGNRWLGDWTTNTFYSVDNIVKFKGYLYQCIESHTSTVVESVGAQGDITKWKIVATTYNWLGDWETNTFYNLNDVVKYKGITYYCDIPHRSSDTVDGLEIDQNKWITITRSDNWLTDWTTDYRYAQDDIVRYGGIVYRCLVGHQSANNISDGLEADQSKWEIVISNIEYIGEWQSVYRYKKNDIVKSGPSLWICVVHHTSTDSLRADESNWNIWLPGLGFEQVWNSTIEYQKGDIVLYGGYAYTALQNSTNSVPSINGILQDTGDWELLKEGYRLRGEWDNIISYLTGDVVRNSGFLYVAIADSTGVQPDLETTWKLLVPGISWKAEWQDNQTYNKGDVVTFASSSYYCIQRHVSSVSDGRPDIDQNQTDQDYWIPFVPGSSLNVLTTLGDIKTHDGDTAVKIAIQNPGTALKVNNAGANVIWENFEEVTRVFFVSPSGEDIAENGRTVSSPWRTVRFACDYILENINTDSFNTTIFVKTGLYEEILPIRVPKNCAVVGDELRSTTIQPAPGDEQKNMFLVRNGSGIRNMTLQGLFGTLGEPNEYLTRRPSAGAYVSLDPGDGPDDESVWIKTKSCYVQNVTTFGTGCIGMKIDGSLHNGGNRSIVANDFTQVLSDGIGYWADNLGRSELVSVFTYFCYIGYLSTNGGILRATNGNNSYGTFGSRAEGVNEDENPVIAKINNRDNEAQTDVIYTNGREIVGVGYEHAGQEYSSATIEFNGTGLDADAVFEEFRDNAISQVRLIDPADSSTPGGINYQTLLNNAQSGNETSITLSAADSTGTPEKYIGMRIFIEAGKGVGQYGIITGYDALTKNALISREFDLSAGWEHITAGYPIEPVLDGTTRYRIEPRFIVDEPLFESQEITSIDNENWKYIEYGEEKFVAITQGGTGETVVTSYSDDNGSTWSTPLSLGDDFVMTGLIHTGDRFIAVRKSLSSSPVNTAVRSLDGISWTTLGLPVSGVWESITTDSNSNVALVSSSQDIIYSSNNGDTFSQTSVGTGQNFALLQYGTDRLVAIESDDNGNGDVAYSDDNGANWTVVSAALTPELWNDITYGDGKFVIISAAGNQTAYSFDGITWYESSITDLETFDNINYAQGVFISLGDTKIAKSQDGNLWKTINDDSSSYLLSESGNWVDTAYGEGNFVVIQGNNLWNRIFVGAAPFVRIKIDSSRVDNFQVYNPGSGFRSEPSTQIFDPVNTIEALYQVRINSGVLSQPVFKNRGTGYTGTSSIITGNGFADIYQVGNTINVTDLTKVPGPGDNFVVQSIEDRFYRVVAVTNLTGTEPNLSATIQISPSIGNQESPEHNENVVIRQEYSQVRLTGHDFLDIGTGNVNSTRYPELYIFGQTSENTTQPQNETTEVDGGRIFYTSTDQDGNFRVGELFRVEQSTGIVSISADFFELDGLTEISLGGIVVGGSAVVIREFSKESTFVANSNNIVPTQRAIARYLESRISSGGSDAITNTLIAGQVRISGTSISTTSGNQINIPVTVNHSENIDGDYAALLYYGFGSRTN